MLIDSIHYANFRNDNGMKLLLTEVLLRRVFMTKPPDNCRVRGIRAHYHVDHET